jgi:hypothetical protein
MSDEHSAFRTVPRTGVIYVTAEAQRHGFSAHSPDWCNLGQNDGMGFFQTALEEKIIVVPGEIFDVNPACAVTAERHDSGPTCGSHSARP